MIVRHGLAELPNVLGELRVARPFLLASPRWEALALPVDVIGRWHELPSERLEEIAAAAGGADVLLALGGGSAIDTAKAVSAETDLPLVSVPTTYAGAEWTTYYGVRDAGRRMRGGGGGARPAGIVYDVELTLDLPRDVTVGTAMNALAHCAEAFYVRGHNAEADALAAEGAALIAHELPRVVDAPRNRAAREGLLRGAERAGEALARSGLALAHALAQTIGGRYGLAHGALNAICLAPAVRFNAQLAPDAVAKLADALGVDDAAARVEELALLGGFARLRDLGVPKEDLASLAEAAAERPGNLVNPRPATPAEIEQLLREVW